MLPASARERPRRAAPGFAALGLRALGTGLLRALVYASVALLLTPATLLARAKTDTVVLENGDRVTGEIKILERGLLKYSTDSIGTLSAEWTEVRGLLSPFYYEITLADGERFFGSFLPGVGSDTLGIGIDQIVRRIPVHEVVGIVPLEDRFWSRFDGSLTFGLSYTKATRIATINLNSHTEYKTRKHRTSLDVSSLKSQTEGQDPKTKSNANLYVSRILTGRWYVGVQGGYERNDELGITSRFLTGLGSGYYLIQSVSSELSTLVAVTVNSENPVGADTSIKNVEAALTTSFSIFRYSSPKTDIVLSATGFANLNRGNRYRAEFNVAGKYEVIKDFIFQLAFYEQIDTNPPSAGASKNDYNVSASVGWTY